MTTEPFVFDPEVEASRKHLRWILGALMLTMLLAALDQTIVSTALPTITSDLGGRWSHSWDEWEGAPQLFRQMVRHAMRRPRQNSRRYLR